MRKKRGARSRRPNGTRCPSVFDMPSSRRDRPSVAPVRDNGRVITSAEIRRNPRIARNWPMVERQRASTRRSWDISRRIDEDRSLRRARRSTPTRRRTLPDRRRHQREPTTVKSTTCAERLERHPFCRHVGRWSLGSHRQPSSAGTGSSRSTERGHRRPAPMSEERQLVTLYSVMEGDIAALVNSVVQA